MKKEHAVALFEMAGFDVKSVHQIPNGYWPEGSHFDNVRTPWWLINTQHGLIEIGWRKRVISMYWEATDFRDVNLAVAKGDEVTSLENLVHAYSYPKALAYLTSLRTLMDIAKQTTTEV